MSIEELHVRLEGNVFTNDDAIKVKLLLEAINDWPDPADTLNEYLEKLQIEFGCNDITYNVIDKLSSKLNPATHAWKMESCGTVRLMMQQSNYKSLNEIISYLENYKVH
jgi:hypothetical protein